MLFQTPKGPIEVEIARGIIAGWTGRDRGAVDHHIAELAALGVAPPSAVPLYYQVSARLFSVASTIEVLGPDTSGEVEPLLVAARGQIWLGLGSDHTDRAFEAVSVAASKQMCAKPISAALWPLEDVSDHLDALILRCEIDDGGAPVRYQEGTLAEITPLSDLMTGAGLTDGGALLCGTLGAIGGVRPASRYRMSLTDPVLDRSLSLDYTVRSLPLVS